MTTVDPAPRSHGSAGSDEVPWLGERELGAWVRLMAVVEVLPAALDTQLRRDAGLTMYEYQVLAMLSEAPGRTLQMTFLARHTNATLPRLSHVVAKLEGRGLVQRRPCPENARATNAELTDTGWDVLRAAAPGHVLMARSAVLDALDGTQVEQLRAICEAVLTRIDPDGVRTAAFLRAEREAAGRNGHSNGHSG